MVTIFENNGDIFLFFRAIQLVIAFLI